MLSLEDFKDKIENLYLTEQIHRYFNDYACDSLFSGFVGNYNFDFCISNFPHIDNIELRDKETNITLIDFDYYFGRTLTCFHFYFKVLKINIKIEYDKNIIDILCDSYYPRYKDLNVEKLFNLFFIDLSISFKEIFIDEGLYD